MPEELLLMVIKSLQAKIEEGFPSKSDQTSLVVSVLCYFFKVGRCKIFGYLQFMYYSSSSDRLLPLAA